MRKVILASLLFLISLSSYAGNTYFMTGNELVGPMRHYERSIQAAPGTDHAEVASFISYVQGAADALSLNDLVCIPPR